MSASSAAVAPGFADLVLDSQAVFRSVLDAMARPGTILSVAGRVPDRPADLPEAAAGLLLALADYETPVRLPARMAGGAVERWVVFHTGARIAESDRDATFALLDAREDAALAAFHPGEDRYPDRSATVIVLCDALEGGPSMTLSGPGIEASATVAPAGLRAHFHDEIAANAERFPLGADLVFVAGDRLFALPRSTRIAVGGTR